MFEELVYRRGKLFRDGKEAGWLGKNGYRYFSYKGKKFLTHRVIFFMHRKYWPVEIDHKDQDKLNNRMSNLRDVTREVNMRNQEKIKGYHRCGARFRAQYSKRGKVYHIGMFDTEAEARAAYLTAIK